MTKKKYIAPQIEVVPFEPENLLAESPQIIHYVPKNDLQSDEEYSGDDAFWQFVESLMLLSESSFST